MRLIPQPHSKASRKRVVGALGPWLDQWSPFHVWPSQRITNQAKGFRKRTAVSLENQAEAVTSAALIAYIAAVAVSVVEPKAISALATRWTGSVLFRIAWNGNAERGQDA